MKFCFKSNQGKAMPQLETSPQDCCLDYREGQYARYRRVVS